MTNLNPVNCFIKKQVFLINNLLTECQRVYHEYLGMKILKIRADYIQNYIPIGLIYVHTWTCMYYPGSNFKVISKR